MAGTRRLQNDQEGQAREQKAVDTEGHEISLPAPIYAPNSSGGGYAHDFKLLGESSKVCIQLPCRKDSLTFLKVIHIDDTSHLITQQAFTRPDLGG